MRSPTAVLAASALTLAMLVGGGMSASATPPPSATMTDAVADAPYGTADGSAELMPDDHNSMLLDLELRPQDEERGQVWIRDTYVNRFDVDGVTTYVATGTTRVPGLTRAAPWNDGIYVWIAPSLEGPWKLVDTTGIRDDQPKGKVWSPEFVGENSPGRTVVAPWQTYKNPNNPATRAGNAWAPELHYIDGKWYIAATMGDQSKLTGTFMLVSEGGPEGPYRNIEASIDHPLGEPVNAANPQYYHIDGGLFEDDDATYLVLHNDLYSKMTPDMENLENPTDLPRFDQQAYSPEPYLEGATVSKFGGKYYLMHAAWALKPGTPQDPTWSYLPNSGGVKDQYDAIVAVSDSFEGPYSPRYTAAIGAGHNNMFEDEDGTVWATFFRNPNAGYWADPSRIDDAALPGVVRLEHSGANGDELAVAQGSIGSRAPGRATLSNTSGYEYGLHDGEYEVALDLWWGVPGRLVRIYENGELVHEQSLEAAAGAPQHVVVPVEDKGNGTYAYTAELVNPYGATSTTSTTVTVRDAAPSTPVVSHDNGDGDGAFQASADLWWGTNATSYRFELDGIEVGSGDLTAATPASQHAAVDLVGVAPGAHALVVVFINAHGETASKPVAVTVR